MKSKLKHEPAYSLEELARMLDLTLPQLRGFMGRKTNKPPQPEMLKSTFRKPPRTYYNKTKFINWFNSLKEKQS